MTSSYPHPNLPTPCPITQLSFGSGQTTPCPITQTRTWQLPNKSLAAANPQCGGCQAAKPEFGSCETREWQLPNQSLTAAKPDVGGCPAAKPELGSCHTTLGPGKRGAVKQTQMSPSKICCPQV
jgi:hypothetical protein